MHLAHLLRVNAGRFLKLNDFKLNSLELGLCKLARFKLADLDSNRLTSGCLASAKLGVHLCLGCGARLNLGGGLGGVHRGDLLGHRFGNRNLHLAE